MILPKNVSIQQTTNNACIEFQLDSDLLYFQGHFDNFPILPGVVQIGWAIYYAEQLFKVCIQKQIRQAKFTNIIQPLDKIRLTLNDLGLQRISYSYLLLKSQHIASSGKLSYE